MHVSEQFVDVDDNDNEERSFDGEDNDFDYVMMDNLVTTTTISILKNCTLYLVVMMKEIATQRLFTLNLIQEIIFAICK